MSDDVKKAADALVDVRKAYRLLYYYQKRVMDLGEAVANQFNYQFFYWRSDHGQYHKPIAIQNSGPCGICSPYLQSTSCISQLVKAAIPGREEK